MLHKVELLVAGRDPEIIPHNVLRFAPGFAGFGHKRHAALLAKRRIGQYHVKVLPRMHRQAVSHMDG